MKTFKNSRFLARIHQSSFDTFAEMRVFTLCLVVSTIAALTTARRTTQATTTTTEASTCPDVEADASQCTDAVVADASVSIMVLFLL